MEIGRRLLIDKTTNKVVHDFGEMSGEVLPRSDINNLVFIDLEYGQYSDEFSRLKEGINSITMADIDNKVFKFELNTPVRTPQQQIAQLQQELLQTQGVI